MSHRPNSGPRVARVLVSLLLGAAARAQSPVIVVDAAHPPPAPGVDFAQISQAVAAAAGGEIVLVRAGSYLPFTVDGKSLAIVADGAVHVNGRVLVHGLAADQELLLRGLSIEGGSMQNGLHVDGCAGPVFVEDCQPTGGFGGALPDGLTITNSLGVTLVRCDVRGGTGVPGGNQFTSSGGGVGLRVRTSLVSAWELNSTGGIGGIDNDNGGYGGPGVLLWQGAQLVARGGRFQGGDAPGGDADFDFVCGCFVCYLGGVGGVGLLATSEAGSTCSGELLGVTLDGGDGIGNFLSGCLGNPGPALSDLANFVDQAPGPTRSLLMPALAAEGELLTLSLDGEPGDAALVLAGFAPGFVPLNSGTLGVQLQLVAVIGALPASGNLDLAFSVPELGPGLEGLLLLAQPLFVPAGGGKLLGSPSATALLDAQF